MRALWPSSIDTWKASLRTSWAGCDASATRSGLAAGQPVAGPVWQHPARRSSYACRSSRQRATGRGRCGQRRRRRAQTQRAVRCGRRGWLCTRPSTAPATRPRGTPSSRRSMGPRVPTLPCGCAPCAWRPAAVTASTSFARTWCAGWPWARSWAGSRTLAPWSERQWTSVSRPGPIAAATSLRCYLRLG